MFARYFFPQSSSIWITVNIGNIYTFIYLTVTHYQLPSRKTYDIYTQLRVSGDDGGWVTRYFTSLLSDAGGGTNWYGVMSGNARNKCMQMWQGFYSDVMTMGGSRWVCGEAVDKSRQVYKWSKVSVHAIYYYNIQDTGTYLRINMLGVKLFPIKML